MEWFVEEIAKLNPLLLLIYVLTFSLILTILLILGAVVYDKLLESHLKGRRK